MNKKDFNYRKVDTCLTCRYHATTCDPLGSMHDPDLIYCAKYSGMNDGDEFHVCDSWKKDFTQHNKVRFIKKCIKKCCGESPEVKYHYCFKVSCNKCGAKKEEGNVFRLIYDWNKMVK